MIDYQENMKKMFDVDAWQANFSKACDLDAIQESFKKFYDVEAIQENIKNFYNPEQFKNNLEQLADAEEVKKYLESLVDQEQVKKGAKLASGLVSTNVNALTDAVVLQSAQVREGVESALKQTDVLVESKDLKAAFEAQKKYAEAQKEVALENFWDKAGLVAGLVENNLNLVKEAFQPAKKAPAKKAPARKAAPKAKAAPTKTA